MSNENQQAPRVGVGSPKGRRYFISGDPELSITVKPQDIIVGENGRERPQKAIRILFVKGVKPRRLRGTGYLGTDNPDGTDRNDNVYWGTYSTDDEAIIDFLRRHEFYKNTAQDNKLERGLHLRIKELDWNPDELPKGEGVSVKGIQEPEKVETPAPEEGQAARPKARMGVTRQEDRTWPQSSSPRASLTSPSPSRLTASRIPSASSMASSRPATRRSRTS